MSILKIFFVIASLCCLLPFVPSAVALLCGIVFALTVGNPFLAQTRKLTPKLLAVSIVGLGAGINLSVVIDAGISGVFYTVASIIFAVLIGLLLGRFLKLENNISMLITFGSAICGGSAIAAAAPVLRAKEHEITVALGVVFTLNALALIIFPAIGNWVGLSQEQFGMWAALAIHDTSSVVGATMQYGERALEVGTTIKLVRALWIIPLVMGLAFFMARKERGRGGAKAKIKLPWFILGFVAMAALVTFIPALEATGNLIASGAKRLLVLTLFLIGAGLSRDVLKQVGFKPFLHGAVLWIVIVGVSLTFIVILMA